MNDTPIRMSARSPDSRAMSPRTRWLVCGRRDNLLPLALAQATPYSVGLVHLERMFSTLQQRRTPRTYGFRLGFAAGASRAALTLRVEEVGARHAAACRIQLPIPHVGIGPGKAPGVCHDIPFLDLDRPRCQSAGRKRCYRRRSVGLCRRSLSDPSLLPRLQGRCCPDDRSTVGVDQGPLTPWATTPTATQVASGANVREVNP